MLAGLLVLDLFPRVEAGGWMLLDIALAGAHYIHSDDGGGPGTGHTTPSWPGIEDKTRIHSSLRASLQHPLTQTQGGSKPDAAATKLPELPVTANQRGPDSACWPIFMSKSTNSLAFVSARKCRTVHFGRPGGIVCSLVFFIEWLFSWTKHGA